MNVVPFKRDSFYELDAEQYGMLITLARLEYEEIYGKAAFVELLMNSLPKNVQWKIRQEINII